MVQKQAAAEGQPRIWCRAETTPRAHTMLECGAECSSALRAHTTPPTTECEKHTDWASCLARLEGDSAAGEDGDVEGKEESKENDITQTMMAMQRAHIARPSSLMELPATGACTCPSSQSSCSIEDSVPRPVVRFSSATPRWQRKAADSIRELMSTCISFSARRRRLEV